MPKPASKKTIAVDIDEVLFPMVNDLIKYVDREHKVKLTPEDFKTYHLEDIWPAGSAEGTIVFESYKKQVTPEIAPVEGAAEALKALSRNYDVIVMTARDVSVKPITMSWINNYFPGLFKGVHFVGNRIDSVTWRTKAEVCEELGVSYLIDDSLKHLTLVSRAGIKGLLFGDFSWNQGDLPKGIVRVNGWQEVLEYFDGTAK